MILYKVLAFISLLFIQPLRVFNSVYSAGYQEEIGFVGKVDDEELLNAGKILGLCVAAGIRTDGGVASGEPLTELRFDSGIDAGLPGLGVRL
jgi:hypothetical protein